MKSKKKVPEIQYWYPFILVSQPNLFGGSPIIKEVYLKGHILRQGRLICKQSMEILKKSVKAKGHKISDNRINGVGICETCQEGYKQDPSLAWAHWINPPELKYPAAPKINPELLNDKENNS